MKPGWTEVALGDVCTFNYGKSLSASVRSGAGSPVYGSNGQVGLHDKSLTDGPTVVIGRKGSFGEVHWSDGPCWPIDTTYFVDHRSTSADLRWLTHRLAGLGLTSLNRAAAVPGLNRDDAYRQRLLLPPLEEQKRIAAILDKADELQAKRRAAIAHLDSLTQAIFLDMFGDPLTVSGSAPLGTLAVLVTKGTTPTSVGFAFAERGIPFIRAQDLSSGIVDPKSLSLFIDDATDHALRRSRVHPQDVLISIAGTIGRCAEVPNDAPPMNCNQAVAIVRGLTRVTPRYLLAWLGTADAQRQMGGFQVKGTISNLSLGRIKELVVPVPPLERQLEFEQARAGCSTTSESVRESTRVLDAMAASLQARAFRGEL